MRQLLSREMITINTYIEGTTMDAGKQGTHSSKSRAHVSGKRPTARILIIDKHPIVREGLRRIIEHEDDLLVCAEADSINGARTAIRESNPQVIIADISLNQGDGIELVRDVRAHYPQLQILVLSIHDEAIFAERMLSVGANGYVTKQATSEQILRSLRCVIDGGIYVSEAVASNILRATSTRRQMPANPIDRLSNRELQVLHLVGKGMSTRESAQSLNLSIKTIESHRQRIRGKLNLRSGTQLVQFAINWFVRENACFDGLSQASAPARDG
jgi:DNA-binding NarL/FixJ family response regulator